VATFFSTYALDAQAASAQTGILASVLLAQADIETGGGTSGAFVKGNNFAGVSYGGSVNGFPTKGAGLSAWIQVLNESQFDPVRQAIGASAQAIALGRSNWAAEHYDHADWVAAGSPQSPSAWTPAHPGTDLISVIDSNNLTQYDSGSSILGASNKAISQSNGSIVSVGAPILAPPAGLESDLSKGNFFINGTSADIFLGNSLVLAQLNFDISQAGTIALTIADGDGSLLASGLFEETSILTFGSTAESFQLVSVDKSGTVLTVTFEAFVVAALRTATGPITIAPGTMTRTAFALLLVQQVEGAGFVAPPDSYLYAQDAGYDRATQEQISRGTSNAPLEDSWTCLNRLAAEIQFVCFEFLGVVYFGPYAWLTTQPPVMVVQDGVGGIDQVDLTYDRGQSTGTLTVECSAGSWFAQIGDCIEVPFLYGPAAGFWLVSKIERDDMEEPDLTITCMQPQPSIPEPTTGGASAAVGAGDSPLTASSQQTVGGSQAADEAVNFASAQIGKPYVWGGEGPNGFDCSGLVVAAYQVSGIALPRTTTTQFNDPSLSKVAPGIANLRPGDLTYFQGSDPPAPGHVAIVSKTNPGTNTVTVIDAYDEAAGIRYDTFEYPGVGGDSGFAGTYFGALRPAP
jgi:cell wall-associated NlpC family hydrolase